MGPKPIGHATLKCMPKVGSSFLLIFFLFSFLSFAQFVGPVLLNLHVLSYFPHLIIHLNFKFPRYQEIILCNHEWLPLGRYPHLGIHTQGGSHRGGCLPLLFLFFNVSSLEIFLSSFSLCGPRFMNFLQKQLNN